ncbi:MAG: hypothetical protein IJJ99_05900 [Oscillospiraceae bacterium]|nr:hypothetical protein [Oscillospiraceae bacterium]
MGKHEVFVSFGERIGKREGDQKSDRHDQHVELELKMKLPQACQKHSCQNGIANQSIQRKACTEDQSAKLIDKVGDRCKTDHRANRYHQNLLILLFMSFNVQLDHLLSSKNQNTASASLETLSDQKSSPINTRKRIFMNCTFCRF